MRTAAKVDANQASIANALRTIGAFVQLTHQLGDGCPDMFVAYRGRWYPLEVKDGDKPPSKQKLTPAEVRWHREAGQQASTFVVNSEQAAIDVVTAP